MIDKRAMYESSIRVPLLMTHGEHDDYGTIRRDAKKWAAYEPDVEYVVIPDAGHNANQDNPAFMNAVIDKFLRRVVVEVQPVALEPERRAARFAQDACACGRVPRLQAEFPEAIKPAARHKTQIERGRAIAAHAM